MKKAAKMWLTFVLSLTIGALTAYGYYYHDPYEGLSCSDCPKVFQNKPNRQEECRACCSAKCETDSDRQNCLNQCDNIPKQGDE